MTWLKRWLGRALAVFLCAGCWLLSVGLLSFGQDWFYDTVEIHGIEELILTGVVYIGGETIAAAFFFLLGPLILWVFWSHDP